MTRKPLGEKLIVWQSPYMGRPILRDGNKAAPGKLNPGARELWEYSQHSFVQ